MPDIGPLELVIILVIILVVVGPKKLPGFGRSLGSGMREFKDSLTGDKKEEQPLVPPSAAQAPVQPVAQVPVAQPVAPPSTPVAPTPVAPADPASLTKQPEAAPAPAPDAAQNPPTPPQSGTE